MCGLSEVIHNRDLVKVKDAMQVLLSLFLKMMNHFVFCIAFISSVDENSMERHDDFCLKPLI